MAGQINRDDIDKHMKRLRGKLFALVEASLPGEQQEGAKKTIRQITQATWKGLVKDAGLNNHIEEEHNG